MVDNDRYCIDILTQISAVVSAIKGVEELVMEYHFHSCVAHAMHQADPKGKQLKSRELMDIFKGSR